MKWEERELIPPAFLFLQASQQDFIQSPAEPFDAAMLYRGERGQRGGRVCVQLCAGQKGEKSFSHFARVKLSPLRVLDEVPRVEILRAQ